MNMLGSRAGVRVAAGHTLDNGLRVVVVPEYAAYRGADGPLLNEVDLDKNAWTKLDHTYFTVSALAGSRRPAMISTQQCSNASVPTRLHRR